MSQDHTNYNMSLISVQVKGITDLEASAEVLCPESGNVMGHLTLRQTLLFYLKLPDGNPMCAELHQCGLQGPVDMIIPNTPLAEISFEMINKQPAGFLYHVLPTVGASKSFISLFSADLWRQGRQRRLPCARTILRSTYWPLHGTRCNRVSSATCGLFPSSGTS